MPAPKISFPRQNAIDLDLSPDDRGSFEDTLRLSSNGLLGRLRVFTGKQGDYIVSIIPTLNVSGYGVSEQDAVNSLKESLYVFLIDLFQLPQTQRLRELVRLGWRNEQVFKRRFSNSFTNTDDLIQNFDHPDQVKTSILTAA